MAKRLEGKPFHLVASHCQRDTRENVVRYIAGQGLAATTPNVSVTSQGRHPKVRGNGHVPYYMVFDHHGDLAHHHMCGAYHGGDGLAMIDWVDRLLKKVPVVYVGKQPYTEISDLAKKAASGKGLAAVVKNVEKRRNDESLVDEHAELDRLRDHITEYHAMALARADALLSSEPPRAVPHLKSLQKQFRGTSYETPIHERIEALSKSKEHRDAIALFATYQKTIQRVNKSRRPSRKLLEGARARLEKALKGKESLPVAALVRDAIQRLRSP